MKDICSLSDLPWLPTRDFSDFLCPDEHEGVGECSIAQIHGFRYMVDICMLTGIGFKGRFLKFEKKNSEGTLLGFV